MGFGSYAGGITRGIQNGVNIGLALRADKRAEETRKIGIQRQAKADERADITWNQKQSAIAEKKRIEDVNKNFQKAAYMFGTAGGSDKITAEQFTDVAKSAGVFDDFMKDNQTNAHIAKFPDGGFTIQFNQKDEAGNLILDENGQPKWFSMTENRGTTDKGVLFSGDQLTKMIMGKFIAHGGDYKSVEPFIKKGMTEREKLMLQNKNAKDLAAYKSKLKVDEKARGIGVKPTYKTDAKGNVFAVVGNKAVPVQFPSSNKTIQQRQVNAQADALVQGVPETLVRPVDQFDVPRTDVLQQSPKKAFTDKVISDETGNERIVRVYDDPNKPAEYINAPTANSAAETPPIQGAKKAPDGKWYIERNGKHFEVTQ